MLWKATLPRLTAQAASQLRAATRQCHTPLHYRVVVLRNAYVSSSVSRFPPYCLKLTLFRSPPKNMSVLEPI